MWARLLYVCVKVKEHVASCRHHLKVQLTTMSGHLSVRVGGREEEREERGTEREDRGLFTSEDAGHCQVTSMPGITSCHHVLRIKHLLGQLGDRQSAILLRSLGGQWGKAGHEEVKAREGHHVDGQLTEISIELTREPQTGGHSRHCDLSEKRIY